MAIEIEPAAKVLGVPVRFVLWGLMRWVWVMCERKRFWVGEVGLMWEGWSVGWVKFVKVGELPGEVGRGREAGEGQGEAGLLSLSSLLAARGGSVADRVHHNNIINPTTTTTTIATTATAAHIQKSGNTTTTTTTDFTLKTAYLPSARPVSIFQLFLTVLATLHAVAPFPTTPGARPKGRTDFFSHDLKVKLEFVGPGGPEGGVEWRWIIEVMRLLPEVMLGRGKFAEVAFLMLVDGEREEVGNGVLWVNEGVGVSS